MARKTKTKLKQKQKQKQSQRVVVNIDNSKKTIPRRTTNRQPTQPRQGTTIINNIPQPQPIYQQQTQQPSLAIPQPNITIFNKPNPPIPSAPVSTGPNIQQTYYDEQFDRLNSNINNLNNRFNQHAGSIVNKLNNLNPVNNYVYVQPQPDPQDVDYNLLGEDDVSIQTAKTVQSSGSSTSSNFTAPTIFNIRQPQPYSMVQESAFKKPLLLEDENFENPLEDIFKNTYDIMSENQKKTQNDNLSFYNTKNRMEKGEFKNETERKNICPICGRIDTNIGNSVRHMKDHHTDNNLNEGETKERQVKNKKTGEINTYTTYPKEYIDDLIDKKTRKGYEDRDEKNRKRATEKKNQSTMKEAAVAKVDIKDEKMKPQPTPNKSGNNKVIPI